MNKQEFQQQIKDMKHPKFFSAITLREVYEAGFEEAKGNALCDSCFLNEPEKPLVPQFVADYIDSEQNSCSTFSEAIDNMDDKQKILDWFYINSETFAKAWLYGYEVEKEKLYTIEIPNPNGDGYGRVYLGRNEDNKIELRIWNSFSSIELSNDWKRFDNAQLTEDEIKKDYKWAWKFAKEVEE